MTAGLISRICSVPSTVASRREAYSHTSSGVFAFVSNSDQGNTITFALRAERLVPVQDHFVSLEVFVSEPDIKVIYKLQRLNEQSPH